MLGSFVGPTDDGSAAGRTDQELPGMGRRAGGRLPDPSRIPAGPGVVGAKRCQPGVARGSLMPVLPPNFGNIPDPSVWRGFQARFSVFSWNSRGFPAGVAALLCFRGLLLFRDPNNDSVPFIFWMSSCVPCGIFPKKKGA